MVVVLVVVLVVSDKVVCSKWWSKWSAIGEPPHGVRLVVGEKRADICTYNDESVKPAFVISKRHVTI